MKHFEYDGFFIKTYTRPSDYQCSLSLSTTVSFVVLSLNIPIFLEGNTKSPIMALGKTYYCKVENFENHIDLTSDREPRWKAGRTTNPSANGIKNDISIKLLCNR